MELLTVIGLEVHNELKTNSKVFCSCPASFAAEPNVHCCPACSGMPGTLPVLNATAIEYTIRAGLALNCQITNYAQFDRKNYYYPDNSKAYQISQLVHPVCQGGYVDIVVEGKTKRIRLNRIHLEEDAGKLVHSSSGTLVDYNRAGVPLIEIVSEPDMSSAEEAIAFLESLKQILKYIGVSDCKMEQGALRCDVNISLHRAGEPYGTRTEMKNIGSFKAAQRAIGYEVKRQAEILSGGGKIQQETRKWDDANNKSFTLRSKEDAQDYRYFPDPDLVPVVISEDDINKVRNQIPMLPKQRAAKYIEQFGLPVYDAEVLTQDKEIADFFDECLKTFENPKILSNWIMTEVLRKLKEQKNEDIALPLNASNFAKMLKLLTEKIINQNAAKTLFEYYWNTDSTPDPETLVKKLELSQNSDSSEIESIIKAIIDANPSAAQDYRSGNQKAFAFFVGQAMKATKGKANPTLVNELCAKLLK